MLTLLLPGLLPGPTPGPTLHTPGRHTVSLPKALNLVPGSKHLNEQWQCPDLTAPLPLPDPNVQTLTWTGQLD
jgi:hypothetical protein